MKQLAKKHIELKHDRDLSISTAARHNAIKWKNGSMLWSEFVNKVSKTQRTNETAMEFRAMSKTDKNKVKDVGGFVGGNLKENRRRSENVMNRSMITLDIDFADSTIKEQLEILVDYAYVLYSTHSHSEHKPRYRIVIPLTRNVNSDEYEPIARKLAERIDMEVFDDTSYEVARLMYWPSTSSDAPYDFVYEDNPILNPDTVLDSYDNDWRDAWFWPRSSREDARITTLKKQLGDPLEKRGLIGAFNRAYTIHELIETHLSDVYEPHSENRYSLKDGSTAGGLVVYDDKFAYSHHGSDVISNKLVNAFDLLRLHWYGEQDVGTRLDTQPQNMPSYKAMTKFARNDSKTIEQSVNERMLEADDEFDVIEDEDTEEKVDNSWKTKLTLSAQGGFESTVPNILLILNNHPALKGKIAYNEFANRPMRKGAVPWNDNKQHEYWTDEDDAGLRNFLEERFNIYSVSKTSDAVRVSMRTHRFHPVRDYLNGVEWDGVERLERLFIKYLGAEDTELNRAATRIAFTAAVARVFKPGIKFDYMLTLYGAQGVGKSMILNRMGRQWFSDSLSNVTGKEAYEALQGAWIIEMAELSATRKAEAEHIKQFISKPVDRFRVAYGRHIEDFPRQCVFFGTTNDAKFLKDRTGNRRFWPIKVDGDKAEDNWSNLKDEEIDQLWAEAKHYFNKGAVLRLPKKLEDEMNEVQETHTEESPYFGVIEEFLEKKIPKNWNDMSIMDRKIYYSDDYGVLEDNDIAVNDLVERERICSLEIWVECLGNEAKRFPTAERREINDVLRNMPGWKPYDGNKNGRLKFGKYYGAQNAFVKESFNEFDLI